MYFKGAINILILLFSGTSNVIVMQAQPVYQVQYPIVTSPAAGTELHILVDHELSRLNNRIIPIKIFKNGDYWSRTGNILYRLIRMSTYDFLLSYVTMINQHEYSGHLARAKQLHAGYTRYEIYLFPPSGGRAFYGNQRYNSLSKMEQICEYTGAMEANLIMAEKIRVNSFLNKTMSFQDFMLYLGARTDFSTYVLFKDNGSIDDINQYLSILNEIAGQDKSINRGDLVLPGILSTLPDPYTIKSLYSLIGQFVINIHLIFNSPAMFQIGKTGLIPYYWIEPAADGPRHSLNGYLRIGKQLFSFCLHKAAFKLHDSYGLQVANYRFSVIRRILSLYLEISEKLLYHDQIGNIQSTNTNWTLLNGKLYFRSSFSANKERNLFIIAGFSMKSPGYTKGYPLTSESVIQ